MRAEKKAEMYLRYLDIVYRGRIRLFYCFTRKEAFDAINNRSITSGFKN